MTGDPDRHDAYRDVARLLTTDARAGRIDQDTVRVASTLEQAGVPSLLLRGPVIARWLYDDPGERSYQDVDLLVPVDRLPAARRAIASLGLAHPLAGAAGTERPTHAETFRGDAATVDLHWTIKGVGAAPQALWRALDDGAVALELGAGTVRAPGPPGRLLIVALHAAQHGPAERPRTDLERAVARVPEAEWVAAARLAAELDAGAWFATGLRAVPGGAQLLDRLAFEAGTDLAASARAEGRVHLLKGLVSLRQTPGVRAKGRLLARELFPTRAFMRTWSAKTGHAGEGLAAAYVRRPLWMARRLPGAVRAYRRARRAAGGRYGSRC